MTDQRRPDEGFQARATIGPRGAARGPLVTTAVIVALLVVAIIKPWNLLARPSPTQPAPSPRPDTVAVASIVPILPPSAAPAESIPAFPFGPRSNNALTAVADDRAAWGMRAVVQSRRGILAGSLLSERWASADVPATGDAVPGAFDAIRLAEPLTGSADVAFALGVTTAPDAMPLDLRFWRTSDDRGWVRLLPMAFPGPEPGSWLWRPDPAWATIDGTWPSGTYRVDALLGPRIVRLQVVLGGTFDPAPLPDLSSQSDEPLESALARVPPGPFAVTELGPIGIPLASSGQFDERTAWLAPYLGAGLVAPAYGSAVSALGLRVAGEPPPSLVIQRVSGVAAPPDVAADVASIDLADGAGGAAVALPLGGHLLADGLYRIVAEWPDGRTADWEIEVAPGAPGSVPWSPLEALSRWVSARSPAGPAVPVVTVGAPDGPLTVSGECSSSTRITSLDALVGVIYPAGARLTGVRALVLGADRAPDWQFQFAPDAVPGVAIVAVPERGLPARDYDLVLDFDGPDGRWRALERICVTA